MYIPEALLYDPTEEWSRRRNESMSDKLRRVWHSLHPLMWFAVMFCAGTVASIAVQEYAYYFVVTAPDRFASYDHLEDRPGVNESQVVQVFACHVYPDILAIETSIGSFMASPQVVDTVKDGDFVSLTIRTTTEPPEVLANGTIVVTSTTPREFAVAALPSYNSAAKAAAKSCHQSPSSTYVDKDSSLYPYGFPVNSNSLPSSTEGGVQPTR